MGTIILAAVIIALCALIIISCYVKDTTESSLLVLCYISAILMLAASVGILVEGVTSRVFIKKSAAILKELKLGEYNSRGEFIIFEEGNK